MKPDEPHGHSHDHHPHHTHAHAHGHSHDHPHDHSHLSEQEVRVRALQSLLTAKGYIDPEAIDRIVQTYETDVGPRNGARVVAKAWSEPAFADWLARDATAAIASLGYHGRQGEHMVALFNQAAKAISAPIFGIVGKQGGNGPDLSHIGLDAAKNIRTDDGQVLKPSADAGLAMDKVAAFCQSGSVADGQPRVLTLIRY